MTREWTESGTIDVGVTLAFDGINFAERDALDIENFARGVNEPTKEDPGGKALVHSLNFDVGSVRGPSWAFRRRG